MWTKLKFFLFTKFFGSQIKSAIKYHEDCLKEAKMYSVYSKIVIEENILKTLHDLVNGHYY